MILAIDISNNSVVLGGFAGDELRFVARLQTNASRTADEYASQIHNVLQLHRADRTAVDGAIIASVVPQLNSVMQQALRLAFGVEAKLVGPGIKTGINIRCDNPSSVGADLICACVAAHHLYGSPSLIVDMGTATKLMVMDKQGAFIGASFIPGVQVALQALASNTAQLPQISLEAQKSVLGKNTIDCMRSGVIYGNASMVDGMIDRIEAELGEAYPLLATGESPAETILAQCRHQLHFDADLVLKGLNILYRKNN